MAKTFTLIYRGEDENEVKCSGVADDIEDIIAKWVDPHVGYLPNNIENTAEEMEGDDELTDEEAEAFWDKDHPKHAEAREKVVTEALRRTRGRFGIGCDPDPAHSDDWMIVEVDVESGETKEYSQY